MVTALEGGEGGTLELDAEGGRSVSKTRRRELGSNVVSYSRVGW